MWSVCGGLISSLKNTLLTARNNLRDKIEMVYVRRKYRQLKRDPHFIKGMMEEFGIGALYACHACEMDCRDFKDRATSVKLWRNHGFWAYNDCSICLGTGVPPIPVLELGKDAEYGFDQSQIR